MDKPICLLILILFSFLGILFCICGLSSVEQDSEKMDARIQILEKKVEIADIRSSLYERCSVK